MNEKTNQKFKKSMISLAIVGGVFIVIALLFYLVSLNENCSEFLSKYWTIPISYCFGHIVSLVKFSVFEWTCFFAVLAILIVIGFIIYYLCKKNNKRASKLGMQLLVSIIGVVCIYTSTVTVSYNRKPVPIPQVENSVITDNMVGEVYKNFMDDFYMVASKVDKNNKGQSECPYTFDQLSEKIRLEYKRLDSEYFGTYTSKPKFITFSGLMSEFQIIGITFTPFGEANVNRLAPYTDIAVTIGHELAHTKGVMRENDANLISYYLLMTSDDPYLKYCGYLAVCGIMNYAAKFSNNKDLITRIPEVAVQDTLKARDFWNRHNSLNSLGEFFNNLYLKFQGESGTDSYFEVNQGKYDKENDRYFDVVYTDVQKMVISLYNI